MGYMRHFLPLFLPLVWACTVTAADLPTLTLTPTQIEQKRTISFDHDSGRAEREDASIEVAFSGSCSARLATGQSFNSGEAIKVTATAVLDTGAVLTLRRSTVYQHDAGESGTPRLQMTLVFPSATSAARTIVRLSGTINAPISQGRRRLVEVADLGQGARTVGVDALPDFELTVQRSGEEVKLSGTNKDFALLSEVKFVGADGSPLVSRNAGGRSSNEMVERRYRVTLPSDGKVALYLHNQVETVAIPFELKNLPLAMEATKSTRKVLMSSEEQPEPVVKEPVIEGPGAKAAEF